MRQDDVGCDVKMIPREISKLIRQGFSRGRVACFTGAGISAESGIPTFRGKGGLWEKYDPQKYAYPQGLISVLRDSPRDFVNFVSEFYSLLFKAHPNPAHVVLATLEKENRITAVITQNVDNLHQQAGSRNVIELHGNAYRIKCAGCSRAITLEKDRAQEMRQLLKKNRDSYIKILKILSRYFPRCGCGGRFRIDIVLFGEMLPQGALEAARRYLSACDLLFIIGTSLAVYPAAGLPLYAKEKGARLIEINSERGALSDLCDYTISGKASVILPQILTLVDK